MSNKFRYFRILKHHKEICGNDALCSEHELIFYVEAPQSFTSIDIWKYAITYKHHHTPSSYRLTLAEYLQYPWFEWYKKLKQGDFECPLIFTDKDLCIEGRHRLRLMELMGITECPAIIVNIAELRDTPRFPPRYDEWIAQVGTNSWRRRTMDARKQFNKFIIWDSRELI
jgi:hypothetical protein